MSATARGGAAARSRDRKAHLGALVRLRENHPRNVPAWLPVERGRLTRNGLFGRCETPRDLTLRMRSAHFSWTRTSDSRTTAEQDVSSYRCACRSLLKYKRYPRHTQGTRGTGLYDGAAGTHSERTSRTLHFLRKAYSKASPLVVVTRTRSTQIKHAR